MADEEAIAEDAAAEDSAGAAAASAEAGSAEADDSAAGAGFLQALRPKAATALSASTKVRDFFIEFSSEGTAREPNLPDSRKRDCEYLPRRGGRSSFREAIVKERSTRQSFQRLFLVCSC